MRQGVITSYIDLEDCQLAWSRSIQNGMAAVYCLQVEKLVRGLKAGRPLTSPRCSSRLLLRRRVMKQLQTTYDKTAARETSTKCFQILSTPTSNVAADTFIPVSYRHLLASIYLHKQIVHVPFGAVQHPVANQGCIVM